MMSSQPTRALPWIARLAWVAMGASGWTAIDQATATSSELMRNIVVVGAATLWLTGVAGLAFASVTTLTVSRIAVPTAAVVVAICWALDASATSAGVAFADAIIATAIVLNGDFARVWVQASAYGAEDRYPLRPPVGYLIASVLTWGVFTALAIAGLLLIGNRRWVIGALFIAGAVGLLLWAWPRWNILAKRWFVLMPIGIVLHDHLVLAETLMLRRNEIASVSLARQGTRAADLTGPAAGHALEITTAESVTALLAAAPTKTRATAIHLTAALVAPSRPGAVLKAARTHGL